MGLESTTTISGLVATNPVASDTVGQADDHLRLLKNVLKTIFPGAGGSGFTTPIIASEAELNYIVGVTSAIQTQLNTHTSNIATAQSTADTGVADAATADGKAVAAQGTANTALADAVTAQSTAELMGADAWANLNGSTGAVIKGHNIASVSKASGSNIFDITFTNAMPNADYAILVTSTGSTYGSYVQSFMTVNGCRIVSGVSNPDRISFAVFAVA